MSRFVKLVRVGYEGRSEIVAVDIGQITYIEDISTKKPGSGNTVLNGPMLGGSMLVSEAFDKVLALLNREAPSP